MALIKGGSYDPDPGDSIRLHRKDDSGRVSHKIHTLETDENGNRWVDIPAGFSRGDDVYLLQTKSMSKRYPRVLPADIGRFRQQPGAEILPVLDLTPVKKNELSYFPEGTYIQVSTLQDLFLAQSERAVRFILDVNSETRPLLLSEAAGGKPVLPMSKKMVILSLEPYYPQAAEAETEEMLASLVAKGYKTFIANNLAHIEMLRGKGVNIIAGPYLYTFNRWAVSFLENQNIGAFITPLENSEQNLADTFPPPFRERVMVSLFAYPALFRTRFRMPKSYDFNYFRDKEEEEFKFASSADGTVVMPEKPFSIVDKAAALTKKGFTRFLIDYSHTKVRKGELKIIIGAMIKGQVLPETSRFNWKDGFYNPEKIEAYRASNERAAAEKAAERAAAKKGGRGRGKYKNPARGARRTR